MESIVFLDDDAERTAAFLEKASGSVVLKENKIHTPTTAKQAIAWIEAIDEMKIPDHQLTVFLDHDLGGEIYVNSNREDCGMEVVRWIVAHKPKIDDIIVHTHNTVAGKVMELSLREVGYSVSYIPFGRLLDRLKFKKD